MLEVIGAGIHMVLQSTFVIANKPQAKGAMQFILF
jgi:hypothetical protein